MRNVDNREIERLLDQMTLEEKVAVCHANSMFTSNGVPRLGIDEISMSDGPHGVRESISRDGWRFLNLSEDFCTYLPTATALAATWNPILARCFGTTLGAEARHRGKDVILGPGVNMIRTPLCGRNFEYFSEDPCLAGNLAKAVVQGVQSQDVAACVKHFALNNQELDRFFVNVEVSKRALHEIYLKAFYMAIVEGGAYSVMGAYNRYLGQHCCHNAYLTDLLKNKWGYDGVYVSDWNGTHDTEEAIFNGLDIEMGTSKPHDEYYLADAFLIRAKEDENVRRCLDDKVRRILRLMIRVGKLDSKRKVGAYNTPKHQQIAYDIASEAIVLLKNENNVLPLDKRKLKKILVVGPNATKRHASGGNSSGVKALYEVTPLEGLQNRLGGTCEIEVEPGTLDVEWPTIPQEYMGVTDSGAGCSGVRHIAYVPRDDGSFQEMLSYCDNGAIEQGVAAFYDVTAIIKPPQTGEYSYRFVSNGTMTISINDNLLTENCEGEVIYRYSCVRGEELKLSLRIYRKDADIDFSMGWKSPNRKASATTEAELLEKAAEADYVIYCGGLDHNYDCESFDKRSMALPTEQDRLIPKLCEANPDTIVVLTAGSPVAMPWLSQAKAVLWTWYGGMECGNALADILLGTVSPSGKLPFTMPKVYADTPVARYGEYQAGNCSYNEGILVGYRGFDQDEIEPLFPFGHGLSYGRVAYSGMNIETTGRNVKVSLIVTNTGAVPVKETVQLYIGDPVCSVLRPPKELRGFEKLVLAPGESRDVTIAFTEKDLCFFDECLDEWVTEPGEFTVFVGASSRDIRLTGSFVIK